MADGEMSKTVEIDPIKLFIEIAKEDQPSRSTTYTDFEGRLVLSYYRKLAHAADQLGVIFDVGANIPQGSSDKNIGAFYDRVLDEVAKRKIDLKIEEARSKSSGIVLLDAPWREKIHTYISHIRRIVSETAFLDAPLRDSILARLNALGAEVDRGRTRVRALSDILVGLCEGVSRGAEALKPAITLAERLIGALARLEGQKSVPALPAPEQMALPAPEGAGVPANDTESNLSA